MIKSITVFCGSSIGLNPEYKKAAETLGFSMAKKQITLIYGGAKVGIMGAVADAVLKANGSVTGVLPKFLQAKELAHEGLTELILVETMHERKMKMNELCDGVIALPGGFGTMEELFEMLTWAQLGLHKKPIALLNTNGFYNALIQLVDTMINDGFLKESNKELLLIDDDVESLLDKMQHYEAPDTMKWLTPPKA